MNMWESLLAMPETPKNEAIVDEDDNKEAAVPEREDPEWMKVINPDNIKFYPMYSLDRGLSLFETIMTRHPPSWHEFFLSAEREIKHACDRVEADTLSNGRAIYPLVPKVLTAFWLCPLFMLKCVIIGQDPYPGQTKSGMPKAIGACFASSRDNKQIPDSLVTVYKELEATVEGWKNPGHPDITCWGRQGVLLLNTALTVEAGKAGAHTGYWIPFTEKLMTYLNEQCKDIVFLLWGKHAQRAAETIYSSRHFKLNAYHPSSMNAGRPQFAFAGCDHFNQANIHLVEKGIHPIDWRIK